MAIALVGTLDTKGPEIAFLGARLAELGRATLVVDVGCYEPQGPIAADVARHAVMAAAGVTPRTLLRRPRGEIMAAMGRGAAAVLRRLEADGRLEGVLGVGGNQGTAIVCTAMRGLGHGLPKLVVSTVASGNTRPYVGSSDIAMLFSVADLVGGPNRVVEPVLRNAAAAISGMAAGPAAAAPAAGERLVAITALGNTHPAVTRLMALLRARGLGVAAFHASGAGGSAMERLVADGRVDAVVDLTPHELTEEVVGAGWYQPVEPGRCTAAGRAGIPQVVAPGSMEYLCFGPRESVPARFRRRRMYDHNPACAHVPASRREMAAVGRTLARRLSQATGPVALLLPLKGWSVYGAPGGPLHDAGARAAFVRALTRHLRRDIPVHRLPLHINDPAFADRCCAVLLELLGADAARAQAG
ncbi:MAG TPA: Tm-1-like ATP-binding domain-containing protein [Methylomirabilota bacterium]|nr:Tm-1-like ATP-binding domain-containing protein [Methylomirabilota bacterium]